MSMRAIEPKFCYRVPVSLRYYTNHTQLWLPTIAADSPGEAIAKAVTIYETARADVKVGIPKELHAVSIHDEFYPHPH